MIYGKDSVGFDTPYLKEPPHWMINILTDDFKVHMEETLQFIKDRPQWFTSVEYEKFKRVTDYMKENPVSEEKIQQGRRDFYNWFTEYDRRRGTDFLKTFPELEKFYHDCKSLSN
jgi:hypothetical protein